MNIIEKETYRYLSTVYRGNGHFQLKLVLSEKATALSVHFPKIKWSVHIIMCRANNRNDDCNKISSHYQNNVFVIQMFVLTIVSLFYLSTTTLKKYPRSRVWELNWLVFFGIFSPTPFLQTLNPKAWIILFGNCKILL